MISNEQGNIKKNVHRFDEDVRNTGSYAYTGTKLSSRFANARISESIKNCFDFSNKVVLDLGCGDGAYTVDFPKFGAINVLGVDPAEAGVNAARLNAKALGLESVVSFEVGNIYELKEHFGNKHFDCIVLRGVLHHLPDAKKALACVSHLADTVIILEPNGYNPILKLLEKFSAYHIQHEERSFCSTTIESWCNDAGLKTTSVEFLNLVPMFCPDFLAKICRFFEPFVEKIPLVSRILCGQVLIVVKKA